MVLIGVVAIAIASWNISDRTRKLKKEQASFNNFKTSMLSNDERFRTFLALDFEVAEQRNAIRLLQMHWEQLDYKGVLSLWPTIDGSSRYVGVFHSSVDDNPDGPNVTIAVLWENTETVPTVVDALTISATEKADFHYVMTEIDSDGTFVISTYLCTQKGTSDGHATWVATSNGFEVDSERSAKEIFETHIAGLRDSGKLRSTSDK